MNKTYRKIFNAARGAMVAVAENVKAASQKGSVTVKEGRGLKSTLIAAAVGAAMAALPAMAKTIVSDVPVSGVDNNNNYVIAGSNPNGQNQNESGEFVLQGGNYDSLTITGAGGTETKTYTQVTREIIFKSKDWEVYFIAAKLAFELGMKENEIIESIEKGKLVFDSLEKDSDNDIELKKKIDGATERFSKYIYSQSFEKEINDKITVEGVETTAINNAVISVGSLDLVSHIDSEGNVGTTSELINDNEIIVSGDVTIAQGSSLNNNGTFTVGQDADGNVTGGDLEGGNVTNNGSMTIHGSMSVDSLVNGSGVSSGSKETLPSLTVGKDLVIGDGDSKVDFVNNAQLVVNGNLTVQDKDGLFVEKSSLTNNSDINVGGTLTASDIKNNEKASIAAGSISGSIENSGSLTINEGTSIDIEGIISSIKETPIIGDEVAGHVEKVVADIKPLLDELSGHQVLISQKLINNAAAEGSAVPEINIGTGDDKKSLLNLAGTIENSGTINAGSLVAVGGSVAGITAGSVTNHANGTMNLDTTVVAGASVTNDGTINSDGIDLKDTIVFLLKKIPNLTSQGSIALEETDQTESGIGFIDIVGKLDILPSVAHLQISGNVTNNATWNMGTGSVADRTFVGSTAAVIGGSFTNGRGAVLNAGTLLLAGTVDNAGTMNLDAASDAACRGLFAFRCGFRVDRLCVWMRNGGDSRLGVGSVRVEIRGI